MLFNVLVHVMHVSSRQAMHEQAGILLDVACSSLGLRIASKIRSQTQVATTHTEAILSCVRGPLRGVNHRPKKGAHILNQKVGTTRWERTVRANRVVPTFWFTIWAQMQAQQCGPLYGAKLLSWLCQPEL